MSDVSSHQKTAGQAKTKTLWQFLLYALFSMVTTVVDLGTFSLFNYAIFTPWKTEAFQFWLLDYSVVNGGLCAFLSFAGSFVISQTFNFFLQRKATFKATNNIWSSGILYAVMVLAVFVLSLWVPTLVRAPIARLVGPTWADLLIKNLNMTLSFLIQFPIIKWVIMKNKTPVIPEKTQGA